MRLEFTPSSLNLTSAPPLAKNTLRIAHNLKSSYQKKHTTDNASHRIAPHPILTTMTRSINMILLAVVVAATAPSSIFAESCKTVTTVKDFDVEEFASAPWYGT